MNERNCINEVPMIKSGLFGYSVPCRGTGLNWVVTDQLTEAERIGSTPALRSAQAFVMLFSNTSLESEVASISNTLLILFFTAGLLFVVIWLALDQWYLSAL